MDDRTRRCALKIQGLLPDGALQIVVHGETEDGNLTRPRGHYLAENEILKPRRISLRRQKGDGGMPDWKDYQEEAAEFFRSLGLDASTDVTIQGVRTKHDVDVLVKSHLYGFDVTWIGCGQKLMFN